VPTMWAPGQGSGGRGLHVLGHDVHRPGELLGRAELDHLGAGVEDRCVPWADVVGVAALEDLFAVPGAKATFKGLPNDQCQCEHIGYVIKGKAGRQPLGSTAIARISTRAPSVMSCETPIADQAGYGAGM
jgi:hypothetical protein